jgi:hypothetical protein
MVRQSKAKEVQRTVKSPTEDINVVGGRSQDGHSKTGLEWAFG